MQNAIRLQAERAAAGRETQRYGHVTNYDPNTYTAKVALQPEGVITGSLPIAALWAGSGWGLFAPPSIGQQVSVSFFEGSINAGFVECCFFNNVDRPLAVPSGEFCLVHASGQLIKLTNDGKLTVSDGQGATVVLNGDGTITSQATTWNHTGDINVTGTLTASTDVIGGGKSLKTHVHGGVQSGGSDTAGPV